MATEKGNADMRPSSGSKAMTVLYVSLGAVMFYFNNEVLELGVGIMYKLFFSMILVFINICVFLVTVNFVRAKVLMRYVLVLCLPGLAAVLVSVPLWFMHGLQMSIVRRGIMEEIYNIGIVLAMSGFVYVFGSKAIWRALAAMLLANFFRIVKIIIDHGLFAYLNELKILVLTFAAETGELIQGAEIHELTFALGIFLVYFSLNLKRIPGKRRHIILALFLTLFFYLSGFKRIGIAANIVAAGGGMALQVLSGKKGNRKGWFVIASIVIIAVCYSYVVFIRGGLADYLIENYGINMMGRERFYRMVVEYYRVDPGYAGQGVGFISRFFSESSTSALHNDILRIFIDLGFFGFFIWMAAYLPIRMWYVAKWQGTRGGALCFAYSVYLIATAATDNTIYYVYVTGAIALLTMSFQLEEQEEQIVTAQREALYGKE